MKTKYLHEWNELSEALGWCLQKDTGQNNKTKSRFNARHVK